MGRKDAPLSRNPKRSPFRWPLSIGGAEAIRVRESFKRSAVSNRPCPRGEICGVVRSGSFGAHRDIPANESALFRSVRLEPRRILFRLAACGGTAAGGPTTGAAAAAASVLSDLDAERRVPPPPITGNTAVSLILLLDRKPPSPAVGGSMFRGDNRTLEETTRGNTRGRNRHVTLGRRTDTVWSPSAGRTCRRRRRWKDETYDERTTANGGRPSARVYYRRHHTLCRRTWPFDYLVTNVRTYTAR